MKLVHKVLDFAVEDVDEAARAFWAVASTETVDRQGDSIAADGWDLGNFLNNPVIPWNHDYSRPPVAKALTVKVEDGRLLFKAQFPAREEYAFADTIFRLYKGGYLRAFSVGFAPIESAAATVDINGRAVSGTRYLKQELYEISCVTLPANPQALVAAGLANPNPSQPLPAAGAAANRALAGLALDALIAGRIEYHLGRAR